MKILHITPKLHMGGAEIVVKDLALKAQEDGHEVAIFTYASASNAIVDELRAKQIPLIQAPAYSLIFLLKHLHLEAYDVIHTHMPLRHKCLSVMNYLLSLKLPLITTEHVEKYKKMANNPFYRWIYRQYNKVICCSHDMQAYIHRYILSMPAKCAVIHNGVDFARFKRPSSRAPRTSTPLQAITLARLDKQKDLVTCISAFKKIQSDIHLSIIGDGKERRTLTKLIRKLDVSDKVKLLGWRNDIPALLSQADLYIQSSVWEGFSLGILEAMAMGLPMIVSDAGALIEAVGDAGLIFPMGDAEALAKHLDTLAQDLQLRTRLSDQSLQRVKRFPLDETWRQYYQAYCEVHVLVANS